MRQIKFPRVFRVFDPEARRLLLKEARRHGALTAQTQLMLWLCIDALVREKIEVPSYTRLTKLILGAAVLSNPFLAHRRGDHPSNAFQASRAATLT